METKKNHIIILIFLIVVTTGTIKSIFAAEVPGVTKDKIIIGSTSPLTGSIAMIGVPIADAIKDYFDYVNELGGIHGRKVEVIAEDDKYDPPQAIASLKKLMDRDKIFALASTSGSPITAALAPTIEREKLPSMCPAPAYGIFEPKPKYIFGYAPFYSDQVVFHTEYILSTQKTKNPRLAFFYQDDDLGQDGYRGLKSAIEEYKPNVVATEKYTRGAIDISSQVLNIKRANPDFIITTTTPSHAIMLLKEAKKIGLQVPIFGCSAARLEDVIKVAGDAADIFYCAEFTALPNETNIPGVKKAFEIRNKRNPADKVLPKYYIVSFVNAMVLAEGMRRSGEDLTREKLRDVLESIKGFNTEGLTSPISYSPNDHCPLTAMRIVKANSKTGFYEALTDWGFPKLNLRKK